MNDVLPGYNQGKNQSDGNGNDIDQRFRLGSEPLHKEINDNMASLLITIGDTEWHKDGHHVTYKFESSSQWTIEEIAQTNIKGSEKHHQRKYRGGDAAQQLTEFSGNCGEHCVHLQQVAKTIEGSWKLFLPVFYASV